MLHDNKKGGMPMPENELLNYWLTILYSGLKKTNKEIEELENKIPYQQKLHELQFKKLNDWLTNEILETSLKKELEHNKVFVGRIPEKNKNELKFLKKRRDVKMFMIDKIEKELRD